jgi:hypothetical protein
MSVKTVRSKYNFFTIGSRNQLFGCQRRDRSRANICSLGSFHFFDSCAVSTPYREKNSIYTSGENAHFSLGAL